MSTEIKVWQVSDGKLLQLDSRLADTGRTEPGDLEQWILSEPAILGDDVLVIGSQVQTRSGPLDLLGIDAHGNTVVIELKRDLIPREALAQAVDYASDIATWDVARLGEACLKFRQQSLEDFLSENLPDEVELEDLSLNQSQRIILVGTQIEDALQRMIEWLSGSYQVSVNALLIKYIRTAQGDELLARTMLIPEAVEREARKRKFHLDMDDKPGSYDETELRDLITRYLSEQRATPRRVRRVLLPLCLDHQPVTRAEVKERLLSLGEAKDETKAGQVLSTISRELGLARRDYLRQIIAYETPDWWWCKDNFSVRDLHRTMVESVLAELGQVEA